MSFDLNNPWGLEVSCHSLPVEDRLYVKFLFEVTTDVVEEASYGLVEYIFGEGRPKAPMPPLCWSQATLSAT